MLREKQFFFCARNEPIASTNTCWGKMGLLALHACERLLMPGAHRSEV